MAIEPASDELFQLVADATDAMGREYLEEMYSVVIDTVLEELDAQAGNVPSMTRAYTRWATDDRRLGWQQPDVDDGADERASEQGRAVLFQSR